MKPQINKFVATPKIGQLVKVYVDDKQYKIGKVVGIDTKETVRYNDFNGGQFYNTQRKEINGEVVIERTPRTFIREVVLLKELNKEQIQLNQLNSQLSQLQSSINTININLNSQDIYAETNGTIKEKVATL